MTVREDSNGRTVTMSIGDKLTVMLSEQAAGGYIWSMKRNSDPAVLTGPTDITAPARNTPGANRERMFQFTANALGQTHLLLAYGRSWESDPQRTFELNVQVEGR